MAEVQVTFEDIDHDGDREVVVENPWLRTVIRIPEHMGEVKYGRRWSWGGRLQSLIYRPTGREYFMTEMIDPEDNRPFGLPDELFATFPMQGDDGVDRRLKMGVGVFVTDAGKTVLDPLPWTWFTEQNGDETWVVFRQEATDLGGYSFVYDKRYRFRPDAAWFALDVAWTNNGSDIIASDWDIHSFHVSGVPPYSSWLVAPKRAWVSYGSTRVRTVLKEPGAIFARPDLNAMVADVIVWDLDEPVWWYALGPGSGDEFYLLRGRFEPYRGLFWHGWGAFTPQGINHVEVPPGHTAVWGFDVTLGVGGKHFVKAGEDCGMTIQRPEGSTVAAIVVHAASTRRGRLRLHALDQRGQVWHHVEKEGHLAPGEPLQEMISLPESGDYATVEAVYEEDGRAILHAVEIVPLAPQRPTALLPFTGGGENVYVAVDPSLEHGNTDGRFLYAHGMECGFAAEWSEAGVRAPEDLDRYAVIAVVGDAWPDTRLSELRTWIEAGGGLLLCAPFGALADGLSDLLPLRPEGDGSLQQANPPLGLRQDRPHLTADRLMLHPDAHARVELWTPAVAAGGMVTLRFTDPARHPACAVAQAGRGRVAVVASRPAWGLNPRSAIWDGWGQYHRAFFGGLMGWLAGMWKA